jgi:hypothetical protein
MSYLNRNTSRKSAPSAELLYLFIVLAAGAATFWYFGHKIGTDLSSLSTAASFLGIGAPVRYEQRAPVQGITTAPAQPKAETSAQGAPYCTAGQAPTFVSALAELKVQIGDVMGTPLECEHPGDAVGDVVQQTSTGLAVYTKLTGTARFTDGWNNWALRDDEVVVWEGTSLEPPRG